VAYFLGHPVKFITVSLTPLRGRNIGIQRVHRSNSNDAAKDVAICENQLSRTVRYLII